MKLQRYNGNFTQCIAQAAKAEQKIATAKQGMQDRIAQGAGSDPCSKGAWFSENFNVVKGRILAAREDYNPLIQYAQTAVDAHRASNEFYLTEDILLNKKPASQILARIAEQDAKVPVSKKRVFDMGKAETHDIPTDSFADDKGIVFLAQNKKLAKDYGLFLKNKAGISEVTFYLPALSKQDYSRGFWLCRLDGDYWSGFDGYDRSFNNYDGSLFGVVCGEADDARKISKASTLDEKVMGALKQKKAFEYNGTLYVPIRDKTL